MQSMGTSGSYHLGDHAQPNSPAGFSLIDVISSASGRDALPPPADVPSFDPDNQLLDEVDLAPRYLVLGELETT
jgi:hypothetical protein